MAKSYFARYISTDWRALRRARTSVTGKTPERCAAKPPVPNAYCPKGSWVPDSALEIRRSKLRFRAERRGFKEVDLVFGAFARAHLDALDAAGLDRFEALLGVPDWQIYDWLSDACDPPPEFDTQVFRMLKDYRKNILWNG